MGYTGVASGIGAAARIGMGMYSAYSNLNVTRRRQGVEDENVGGTTYTRRRHRVGRRKRRSSRAVFNSFIGSGQHIVLRWQQLSDSILGPGRIPLGWCVGGGANTEWLPIHFMSLTQGQGIKHEAKGCRDDGMKKIWFDSSATNSFFYNNYPSQESSGNTGAGTAWRIENIIGSFEAGKSIYHAWTDIRLNLYGTRCVPITYTVYVMQVPESLDPQMVSQYSAGTEIYNMIKDMTRPLVGNPLNMNGRVDWPKDVRIMRKYNYTIQPLGYSDQASIAASGSGASNGHVRQVKLFLRHDRMRDYNWSENKTETVYDNGLSTLGWDENQVPASSAMSDVETGKRLYLFITATSPMKESTERNGFVDTDLNWAVRQGSYDILVRNKFVNV